MSLEDAIRENTLSNERMQDSIERQEHEKIKNPYEILFRLAQIFTIVFVSSLLWRYDFFSYFPILQETLFTIMLSMNPAFVFVYSTYAILLAFLIYFDIIWYLFIKTFFFGFDKSMKSFSKSFQTYQVPLLIILVFIFAVDMSFFDGEEYLSAGEVEFRASWDEEEGETKSKFERWIEQTSCQFSPACLLEQKNINDVEVVDSTSYRFTLEKDKILNNYQEQYLNKIPIPYSVEAKGNEIILDKLECYIESVDENNLINTTNLNGRIIKHNNERIVDGLYCDLSSLAAEKYYDKEVKIYPVLYYTIITDFAQEIPFVDYNEYKLKHPGKEEFEIESLIQEEYSIPKGVKTTDIIEIEPILSPEPPVILQNPNQFSSNQLLLQIKFRSYTTSLGSIEKTTILNMTYPSTYLNLINERQYPVVTNSRNGESSDIIEFGINSESTLQGSEIIREDIKFSIETQMKLSKNYIEFVINKNS